MSILAREFTIRPTDGREFALVSATGLKHLASATLHIMATIKSMKHSILQQIQLNESNQKSGTSGQEKTKEEETFNQKETD